MLRHHLLAKQKLQSHLDDSNLKTNEKPLVSEWKLGLCGLVVSLVIILAKLYVSNQDAIRSVLIERKYVTYEEITEDGRLMFKYTLETAVKYSSFWLPIVCGVLTTYFTWIMVYLDSNVPGEQPPSPFSPTKYKIQSGHSIHFNYLFAIIVGVLVSCYMYWRGISL
ncbi:ADP-ribosylation factor-like protein 6-interacting protein 6 [Aethina tumida]|uniref:ADP-ribosylation factor-like protein 6-interacting protein 6 n=1 Tax=Aethina tumida TaxID=116153 RepID=UPI00096AEAF7|nr:ADP-ribosylation factor-like protein 6-interacting protein 6 [Aethina tumida]